ncbi:MAG: HNH endonuclease [Corallococcus sp.]|nr:HNH endonuclease [Corallococcus sp.]
MKIFIKERFKAEITSDVAGEILQRLHLTEPYDITYVKGNGRCLIAETDDVKVYVIVSRAQADGRNAFLAQYIPTVLSEYIADTAKNKKLCIFLLDTSDKAKSPFIIDTYRTAKTLGIDILNESSLGLPAIQPYNTFADWKYAKSDRQQYNPANNASYAMEDEGEYTVFGKLYGANGKESAFVACQLAQIAKREGRKVNFVQVKEHGTERVSAADKELMEAYGVCIAEGAIVLADRKTSDKSTCRKQEEFKFNLLGKYGKKKCYLCGCDIESAIVASHVHRITDIDKSALTDAEKRKQAVDADNGLWLCANHDRMFECGQITFDTCGKLVVSSDLTESQTEYVKHITAVTQIDSAHLTDNMKEYLAKHNKRVKLGL